MKKLLLSILAVMAFVNFISAQDDIILRTGEEIKAKVQEVGTSEVKYKRADNLTGPLYSIWKREVFMIKYENGTKDVFAGVQAPMFENQNPMSKGGKPMPGDYKSLHHLAVKRIASGAVMIGVGAPILLTGVSLTIAGAAANSNFDPVNGNVDGGAPLVATGMLLTAAGIALEIIGPITLKKGLKYRRMAKEAQANLGFVPIQNPGLDRYAHAMNRQTLGAVTFNF